MNFFGLLIRFGFFKRLLSEQHPFGFDTGQYSKNGGWALLQLPYSNLAESNWYITNLALYLKNDI